MPNLVSLPFQLIIAGIDRSANVDSINLSQPDTSGDRLAVTSGTINLIFNALDADDYTYISSQAIAALWAQGALVTYKIANDSGTLVNHPLSGGKLFILKEPSPPRISNGQGSLSINIGCDLAYQNQRTADIDPSGIKVGVSTARNTVVERFLAAAKVGSYSIPALSKPFDYPVPKVGGSLIQAAAKIAGAVNHVLYCDSLGTAIASPIDLNGTAIATLTIGADERDWEPVDGSNIPTVSELTVSGTSQQRDSDYPILIVNTNEVTFSDPFSAFKTRETIEVNTKQITSELYESSSQELRVVGISIGVTVGLGTYGFSGLYASDLYLAQFTEKETTFTNLNQLSTVVERTYTQTLFQVGLYPPSPPSKVGTAILQAQTPIYEQKRIVTEYFYGNRSTISRIVTTEYDGTIIINGSGALLLSPKTRTTISYANNGAYWSKTTVVEASFGETYDNAATSVVQRTRTINGKTLSLIGFPDIINTPNFKEGTRTSATSNDDANRPPATTYSTSLATKEKEIFAKINVIPLAGIASKEKQKPLMIDYLIDKEQAYDYGQLELTLMAGRKQAHTIATALTDNLLNLRPKCRINIIYRSHLYRCLVDAISYSQNLTERTIGFICDVISTSPVSDLTEINYLVSESNIHKVNIGIDLAVEATLLASFDFINIGIDLVVEATIAAAVQSTIDIAIAPSVFATITPTSTVDADIGISPLIDTVINN